MGLPAVVVPCVHPNFMSIISDATQLDREPSVNDWPGPQSSPKQNIPPVNIGCATSEHLGNETWSQHSPDVATHVIWSNGQEDRRLQPAIGKYPP
jgi:hypothetical protein